jgi:hypothetical protein
MVFSMCERQCQRVKRREVECRWMPSGCCNCGTLACLVSGHAGGQRHDRGYGNDWWIQWNGTSFGTSQLRVSVRGLEVVRL